MRILLLGCGHMGQALLRCFEKNPHITTVHIVDPRRKTGPHETFRHIDEVTDTYDAVILAVKPQVYRAMHKTERIVTPLVLSVIACITGAQLQSDFPNATIVRLMPNMGVAYGKGLTTAYTQGELQRTEKLLEGIGKLLWVDTEAQLDALTVFNGCGPGLLLAVTQAFAEACVNQGFTPETAQTIMRQVFIGTAAMLENKSDTIPELVASVATKGGVTEACLNAMTPALQSVIKDTVHAGLQHLKR